MTTWSPSFAFEPFLRSSKSFADAARFCSASSTAASSISATSFSSLSSPNATSGTCGSAS